MRYKIVSDSAGTYVYEYYGSWSGACSIETFEKLSSIPNDGYQIKNWKNRRK